jgi:hypothetical protein
MPLPGVLLDAPFVENQAAEVTGGVPSLTSSRKKYDGSRFTPFGLATQNESKFQTPRDERSPVGRLTAYTLTACPSRASRRCG